LRPWPRHLLTLLLLVPCLAAAAGGPDLRSAAADAFRQGRVLQARALLMEADGALAEVVPAPLEERAQIQFDLGACALALDDRVAAAQAFRQSLALFEQRGTRDDLAVTLALEGLAAVMIRQENLPEAQACIDRALRTRETLFADDHPQVARLQALGAMCAQRRGDVDQAAVLYDHALATYRRIHGNYHPRVVDLIHNLGVLYAETGFFQTDIMFQQAVDVRTAVQGHGHLARANELADFGRWRWSRGNLAAADSLLGLASGVFAQLGTHSRSDHAECLLSHGRVLLARHRDAQALQVLQAAAAVFEASWWRGGLGSERSLVVSSPYALLAVAQLRADQPERAFTSLQAHHGRAVRAATRLLALPTAELAVRDSLVSVLDRSESRLGRLEAEHEARQRAGSRAAASLRQDLAQARLAQAQAEAAWAEFQTGLRQRHGDDQNEQVSARQLGAALAPDERLVGWLDEQIGPGMVESWGWDVSSRTGLTWRRPAPAHGAATAAELRQAWATGGDPDPLRLAAFSAERLAALARAWPELTRLFVVPSAEMAGFPIGLLTCPRGEPLINRCDITCLTAPGQLAGRRPAVARGDDLTDLLVVADPPFSAAQNRDLAAATMPVAGVLRSALAGNHRAIESLPRLAGSRQEAAAIATMFPAVTSYLGADATEANLRALAGAGGLARFDVIHLATHAIIDAERPGESALVLAQSAEALTADDGLLCAREIERQWRLDAELVTLSACETGLGRRVDGEGYLGFAQVLLGAGARHVLASLWPVDDRATTLLMEHFYANLTGRGGATRLPAARALREAQMWLRDYTTPQGTRPYASPRYWGGFVLFGRG
jgi:tetratricopeptide (TPR) repeat protein